MQNIENFIKNNIDSFNSGELNLGHKERFNKRIISNKRKIIFGYISSIAAIGLISLIIWDTYNNSIENKDYKLEMYNEASIIIELAKNTSEFLEKETINNVNDLINDSIPLEAQLPEELSKDEKAKILKEYYNSKTEG